jgi:hypothetical protein
MRARHLATQKSAIASNQARAESRDVGKSARDVRYTDAYPDGTQAAVQAQETCEAACQHSPICR